MSEYKVAIGTDVALVDLDTLTPQPASEGIRVTRRTSGADGAVYDEGRYVELVWNVLQDATMYQALLTQFGLSAASFAAVTVYVRSEVYAWVRVNGIAVRPELGRDARWNNAFPRSITILVKNLEESAA
jgi:hypothetical protein